MYGKPTTVHGLVSPCMANAIEAVQKGMTQSMAGIRFGIPITSAIAITEVIPKHTLHGLIKLITSVNCALFNV